MTSSTCSVCQSDVPTRPFPYRSDGSDGAAIGEVMPLSDPRTWHLCYVCANTHISSSNKTKYDVQNHILGALTNVLLDAIVTGKDPREAWGAAGAAYDPRHDDDCDDCDNTRTGAHGGWCPACTPPGHPRRTNPDPTDFDAVRRDVLEDPVARAAYWRREAERANEKLRARKAVQVDEAGLDAKRAMRRLQTAVREILLEFPTSGDEDDADWVVTQARVAELDAAFGVLEGALDDPEHVSAVGELIDAAQAVLDGGEWATEGREREARLAAAVARVRAGVTDPSQVATPTEPVELTAGLGFSDAQLVHRVVKACAADGRRRHLFAAVADRFSVGSTTARLLCRRFGFDPDEEVGS